MDEHYQVSTRNREQVVGNREQKTTPKRLQATGEEKALIIRLAVILSRTRRKSTYGCIYKKMADSEATLTEAQD